MLRSYSQLVLDLSVKKPCANCWAEGIDRTSGSQDVSKRPKERRGEFTMLLVEKKLSSHVRSQNGMSTQAAPTGEWSGVFSRG